jgi:DNA-binding IclR family transcriptional regulator
VVFVERIQALSGIALIGERQRRVPLHTTSAGKVLAAFNPETSRARLAAGFPVLTDRTILSARAWRACLAEVIDTSGLAVAAVSVAGPSSAILDDLDRTRASTRSRHPGSAVASAGGAEGGSP